MQMGHMPLVGDTSLTLVVVPQVDLPFRYALFLVTRSLILDSSPSHVYICKPRRTRLTPRTFKDYVKPSRERGLVWIDILSPPTHIFDSARTRVHAQSVCHTLSLSISHTQRADKERIPHKRNSTQDSEQSHSSLSMINVL